MQYDNSDDPFGFWDDEPTRALTRTHAGTRSHGDTGAATRMIPVVRSCQARRPEPTRPQRNPLVTRIALLVGVMLLFVPIALSLRSGNTHLRAADFKPVETISIGQLPPAPIALTEAPTTSALATTAAIVTEAVVVTPAPTEAVVTAAPANEAPATAAPKTEATQPKPKPKPTPTVTQAPPVTAAQAAEKTPCTATY